ncbi:MAG: site-specific DNA-methyltransferase [Mesorhizobium sp.]|uniref:site-specific DNA-methyltransferase n=1 Tax=Mesorhizobium sp. TaxID=1871066 RepID=UPI001AC8B3D7|nr:site-specific DNA-methyltransferase [Mesorhizobium sp.]MBN9222876.1 site-specific DNA-methyltransferase [Mesorhizobium sp.]
MAGKYDDLTREQLVRILQKRDRERRFGLVWERDDIEADLAVDENFVVATLDQKLSERPSPWQNLIIEGDNYDALRWLRMAYAGRVKCIYIDPPYNTGNKDWVYNDHYMDPNDRYRHSTWLEFLYRRLILARDLLTEDGVLLVSINDENRAKLDMLMEEALPGMRVGSLVWRTRTGGNEGGQYFYTDNHEHILAFGKPDFRFGGSQKSFDMYANPDGDLRGEWTSGDLTVNVAYTDRRAGKGYFPIYNPETDVWYPCNPDAVWRYASKKLSGESAKIKTRFMEDWIQDRRIRFPPDERVAVWPTKDALFSAIDSGDVPKSGRSPLLRRELPDLDFWVGKKVGFGTPRFKRYKSELRSATQPLSSWITPRLDADAKTEQGGRIVSGTNDEGAKVIKEVFGEKTFNYAKPVSLVRELIRQSTAPGDLVLDFFAGSATTGQAVLELNAEDNGDRRFILVSSTEKTEDEPDKNLCRDVTSERIRLLNKLEDGKYADLSAGFAYLRMREVDFSDLDYEVELQEIWSTLEAMHELPLTVFDAASSFNAHDGDGATLILVDRPDQALRVFLEAQPIGRQVFIYAWAPGVIREWGLADTIELRAVRDVLKQRFQQ